MWGFQIMTQDLILLCGFPIIFIIGYAFGKMSAESHLKSYKNYLKSEIYEIVMLNPMNMIKEKLDKLLGDM